MCFARISLSRGHTCPWERAGLLFMSWQVVRHGWTPAPKQNHRIFKAYNGDGETTNPTKILSLKPQYDFGCSLFLRNRLRHENEQEGASSMHPITLPREQSNKIPIRTNHNTGAYRG